MISRLLALLILTSATPCGAQLFLEADEGRPWVSRDGKSRVVGVLAEVSTDQTVITLTRSDNQKQVEVPVERLSAVDYLYIRDHLRRSSSVPSGQSGVEEPPPGTGSGLESEPLESQFLLPMAFCAGKPGVDRWMLKPAISVHLPSGTTKWQLISPKPILFGAFRATENQNPDVSVYFDHQVVDDADRRARIAEQNEATRRFLEERGASDVAGEFLLDDPTLNFQKSVLSGSTFSGNPITCETHLRFDAQGILVFRVFGSPERIQEMIPTIDDYRYLDSEEVSADGGEALADSPTTAVAAEVNSSVAPEVRSDFAQFRERAIGLLSKANNAKEVMERLAEPEGLQKLKQSVDRWDSAVISFDVRKRLRLKKALEALDWASAVYAEEQRVLSFTLTDTAMPKSIQFVNTEDGWKIIN